MLEHMCEEAVLEMLSPSAWQCEHGLVNAATLSVRSQPSWTERCAAKLQKPGLN